MSLPAPLDRSPLPTAVLLLLATFAALLLRVWGGYSYTPSDEHNWTLIAAAVQQGVNWPISGPLHFATHQALARTFDWSPAIALAVLGVLSVPAVLGVYVLAYRWLGFHHAGWPLLALSLSTYFWAPLLESRPQQWGQALALLCVSGAWRVLATSQPPTKLRSSLVSHGSWRHARLTSYGVGSLLFACLAWVHILSAALTFGLCLALSLFMLVTQQTRWQLLLLLGACSLPGLLLIVWPTGPYQTMWLDIRHSQLRVTESHVVLGTVGLVALASLAVVLAKPHGNRILSAALAQYDTRPRTSIALLMALAGIALGLQAGLLPDQAWQQYDGSVWLFLLFQLGNLFYFWLLLHGLHLARRAQLATPITQWACLAQLLTCAALVGGALLVVSFFLRDANWLLRFISYALPLTAPFVALALARLTVKKTARWVWLLGALSLSVAAHLNTLLW